MADRVGWVATDSASAGIATALKAAPTLNKQLIITGVSGSYSTTDTGLLQIKDGSTVVWEATVYDSFTDHFPNGLAITPGTSASAVLAAGTNLGKVNLVGYTL